MTTLPFVPPVSPGQVWRAAAIVWVTALAVIAAAAPALGRVPGTAVAQVVVDRLADEGLPSAAEVATSIRRLDAQVAPIDAPAPRPLGQQHRDGDRTTLVVATDVLFAFDDDQLTPRARRTLRDLAADLVPDVVRGTDVPGRRVRVVGHTDSVGTDAYNQQLSERRAAAVATVLGELLGEDLPITAEGRGERDPVADEDEGGAAAAARNRRVEILVEG